MERLVPLVVAAAQDGVVHALQAQSERLDAEHSGLRANQCFFAVLVVGAGGHPVYARGRISLRDCLRSMHREQPRHLVEVDLEAEEGVVACRLDSLYGLRLVVSGGEGLGPDIVGRLRCFKNHVTMRVYGKRLIVSAVLDPNAVAGSRVFPHINVEVGEGEATRDRRQLIGVYYRLQMRCVVPLVVRRNAEGLAGLVRACSSWGSL